jgi:hypothetical protein
VLVIFMLHFGDTATGGMSERLKRLVEEEVERKGGGYGVDATVSTANAVS